MVDPFVLKLVLSFIVGATWITGATMAAERFGTKVGGILAGIPSTAAIALFFIGWSQGTQAAVASTPVIPVLMGVNALFVAIYIVMAGRGILMAASTALVVWFIAAVTTIVSNLENFSYSVLAGYTITILSYVAVEQKTSVISEDKRGTTYTVAIVLMRALISGTIIASAVLASKLAGPLVGGALAAFPASMLSSIIIVHGAHGPLFSTAFMKVFMISGPVNTILYLIVVHYSYPQLGLMAGTLLSYGVSLISSYFTYRLVHKYVK